MKIRNRTYEAMMNVCSKVQSVEREDKKERCWSKTNIDKYMNGYETGVLDCIWALSWQGLINSDQVSELEDAMNEICDPNVKREQKQESKAEKWLQGQEIEIYSKMDIGTLIRYETSNGNYTETFQGDLYSEHYGCDPELVMEGGE